METRTIPSVNNVSRALVNGFTLKFVGEVLQDTNRYDLYHTFSDLFLTAKECQNKMLEGTQSGNLNELRSRTDDVKTDNERTENLLRLAIAHSARSRGPA